MINTYETLIDFINTAQRNRNYPEGTAWGFKAAVRLFGNELNQEERESFDLFREHIPQIYQSVFQKNKEKISPATLEAYRKRIIKLFNDYETYGTDPTKLASWRRPVKVRSSNSTTRQAKKTSGEEEASLVEKAEGFTKPPYRSEYPLESGEKAIIIVPASIKESEIATLISYLEHLKTVVKAKTVVKE